MEKTEEYFDNLDNFYDENGVWRYGTPSSILLKEVREAGFKPIGISIIMCEETFIFKGEKEAEEAWKKFKPEGWWYSYANFVDSRRDYVKKYHDGDPTEAAQIFWLDKNFEGKEDEL
jgi:hypothetical protein